ncbi:SRPBCC family protein [Leisingera daeponensis]|uniref:SRPBCC family protein n=1 Tax=Leisingera daeponensis TaxID=405746 RepID=A0ABS7NHX6_9RHOB|nr:SRPBCC family protein [Leisingera daeponensis]MBY6058443.1 SRPBCC family protein [Leisingera daeponensis]MBY6140798.1 SRPBCC family protein [Leisingera daeponensis]
MEFHSKEDIEAPIAEVFEAVSDFSMLERSALRRGIELQRTGDPAEPESGLAWDLAFSFRGKQREAQLTLASYAPPSAMALDGSGSGIDGRMEIELLALSPQRTRMSVRLKLSAASLTGRLLVQSLKLARSNLNRRFKLRLADYARITEERLSRTA